jgi:hypothetical protein
MLVSSCLKFKTYLTRCEIGLLLWAKAPVNLNVIEPSFEPFVWFVRNSWRKIRSVIWIIREVDLLGPLCMCNVQLCILQSILKLELMTFQSFKASCMLSLNRNQQPTTDNQQLTTRRQEPKVGTQIQFVSAQIANRHIRGLIPQISEVRQSANRKSENLQWLICKSQIRKFPKCSNPHGKKQFFLSGPALVCLPLYLPIDSWWPAISSRICWIVAYSALLLTYD